MNLVLPARAGDEGRRRILRDRRRATFGEQRRPRIDRRDKVRPRGDAGQRIARPRILGVKRRLLNGGAHGQFGSWRKSP